MIIDARTLDADTAIACDICIVGAGPAGLALALELKDTPLGVVLLETGGIKFDPDAEDLGRTESGLRFGTVDRAESSRRIGGNANAWSVQNDKTSRAVRLLPFAASDFEKRLASGTVGWPIGLAELAPHYQRAQKVFGLPDAGYDATDWESNEAPQLPLAGLAIKTQMYQFGDGHRFSDTHRETLERSPSVTIYRHATAVCLETGTDATRLSSLRAESLPGRSLRVSAKTFVLAGGGLSNVQLLLSSLADGAFRIGPSAENIGRHFMDHLLLAGGELIPYDRALIDRMALYDLRIVRDTPVMGHLQIEDERLLNDPLLNLSMILFPREEGWQERSDLTKRQQAGFEAAIAIRQAVRDKRWPTLAGLLDAAVGLDGVVKKALARRTNPSTNLARGGWSRFPDRVRRTYDRFEVIHQAEQAPHAENRVLLGTERDAFGMRRVSVDWRWHEEDIAATVRAQDLFRDELERGGVGRFEIAREADGGPVVISSTSGHFMGITRMSIAAKDGVVDTDCAVHGVGNLFIASGGVFPIGGFANPTLTILAMTLRLADHLKQSKH